MRIFNRSLEVFSLRRKCLNPKLHLLVLLMLSHRNKNKCRERYGRQE